ncbi:ferredoxin [Nocardioides sp. NPDC101246]|uniref:ferredoxin n=1 Tax=Nocardioides sp. NPDC101246 TaxID=3364336 RepID=UPI0038239A58
MHITIDPDLCEGNAVCEALAPLVFELDDQDQARVLPEAHGPGDEVAEEHRTLVERAVGGCPRLAIDVLD